jgi:hypothetical protein
MTRAVITSTGIEILGTDSRLLSSTAAGSVGSVAAAASGATGRSLASAAAAFVGRFHAFSQSLISGGEDLPLSADAGTVAAPNAPTLLVESTIEQALASVPSAERIFHIARLGSPFTFVADSVAAFAEDAASIPAALGDSSAPLADGPHPHRAWFVTAAVAAADLALIAYFYRRSPSAKSRRREAVADLGTTGMGR